MTRWRPLRRATGYRGRDAPRLAESRSSRLSRKLIAKRLATNFTNYTNFLTTAGLFSCNARNSWQAFLRLLLTGRAAPRRAAPDVTSIFSQLLRGNPRSSLLKSGRARCQLPIFYGLTPAKIRGDPPSPRKFKEIVADPVALIKMNCVAKPPPSPIWGNTIGAGAGRFASAIGNAVNRKSPRLFESDRRVRATKGEGEEIRTTPVKPSGKPPIISPANLAACPPDAIFKTACPFPAVVTPLF